MRKSSKTALIILCVTVTVTAVLCYVKNGLSDVLAAEQKSGRNITRTDTEQPAEPKYVALTFDDGPSGEYTELLLDGLKTRDVKATFFLLGKQAKLYPDTVKRIQEEGHLIGNHTYNHVNLGCLSEEEACMELEKTNNLIFELTGEYPEYFRPPFGSAKQKLDSDLVMIEVLWDIDTLDWSCQNVERILKKGLAAQDGDIILMHDAYATSVTAALELIDELTEKGYEFVTVDKLISP